MSMPAEDTSLYLKPYRFTVEKYQNMVKARVFEEGTEMELIDGEIYDLSPFNQEHAFLVQQLKDWFASNSQPQGITETRHPVILDEYSQPEPDLVLAKPKRTDDTNDSLRPQDILLLVEVVDSSLEKDRRIKLPKYAEAGIPEAWLLIPDSKIVEVYTHPGQEGYKSRQVFRQGQAITSPQFPGLTVDEVFRAE